LINGLDFKNKRFLILSREMHLPVDKKETLDQLLKQNQTLYKASLLKEQLLDIMDETNVETVMNRLTKWKQNVEESTLKEYDSLVKTLEHYLHGVHNYFKHHITNSGSEGLFWP